MNNYQQLVLNKNRPKIPKDVRKLMGPKGSISEVREKALAENPGSYCISWRDIAICVWSVVNTMYKTHGIFPPSIIIDHKNAPETDTFRTEAIVNTTWLSYKNNDGNTRTVIPQYMELRIYHKNVMQCVYKAFKHYLPESAMIAYMTAIIFHEYHHYLDYYDLSYEMNKRLSDKYTADEYFQASNKMYAFVHDKDVTADERETERSALIDTLTYMAFAYGGRSGCSDVLKIIPGGPYDMLLREKNGKDYRMASLMVEYEWIQWHLDFDDNLTNEDIAKYEQRKKKIFIEFKRQFDKNPTKMIIVD